MNLDGEHRKLVSALRRAGKRGGDLWAKHYLRSPFPVLGVSVPSMRGIVRAFRDEHPDLTIKELNAIASRLWAGRTYDEKTLAVTLLDAYAKGLNQVSWRLLDRWVDGCAGWGMCDGIAIWPIAKMVHAKPERFRELELWAQSDNLWRRRIAVYALHDFVYARELENPFALLERLLYDPELWVQRAVGTWLRECGKKDRPRTEAFLRRHVKGLPKVVITVATERSPKGFREELRHKR